MYRTHKMSTSIKTIYLKVEIKRKFGDKKNDVPS